MKLYPSVGLKKTGEHVRINFGQTPFVYDIDAYMRKEREIVAEKIHETSTSKLTPHLSETELIQTLVSLDAVACVRYEKWRRLMPF